MQGPGGARANGLSRLESPIDMGTGEPSVERKHSGLGIASFVVSIITGLMMFMLFVVAGVMETSTPGGMDENSVEAMLVGLFLFALLFLDLLAAGLGVAGLFQKERRKLFAILGLVFAAATIVITLLLVLIGLMA